MKNGYGKLIIKNGEVKYEGEWYNDKPAETTKALGGLISVFIKK